MDVCDDWFVLEVCLASFCGPQPVSGPTGSSRDLETAHWPCQEKPSPIALAKAGFYFDPRPDKPENVKCFLCEISLHGWNEHDDPVQWHLNCSPTCGWAIMVAIDAGFGNYKTVNSQDPVLVAARRATFAGRWPHETREGFQCTTKKLVESGFMYTPLLDADDKVICPYCNFGFEKWGSEDVPFDLHLRFQPDCPFFALMNQSSEEGEPRQLEPPKPFASRCSQSLPSPHPCQIPYLPQLLPPTTTTVS